MRKITVRPATFGIFASQMGADSSLDRLRRWSAAK
jgi:hypothetical protein